MQCKMVSYRSRLSEHTEICTGNRSLFKALKTGLLRFRPRPLELHACISWLLLTAHCGVKPPVGQSRPELSHTESAFLIAQQACNSASKSRCHSLGRLRHDDTITGYATCLFSSSDWDYIVKLKSITPGSRNIQSQMILGQSLVDGLTKTRGIAEPVPLVRNFGLQNLGPVKYRWAALAWLW